MKTTVKIIITALLSVLSFSSCMKGDISLEDLTGTKSSVTVTCDPASLSLKVGQSANVSVTVTGTSEDNPVSCLSSDPDVAEAYEIDGRTLKVRGITEGKATVSVTCAGSNAVKVEVTVNAG